MGLTVSEALASVYKLEAEEQAKRKQVLKSIDELESFVQELNESDIEEYKRYGIDILPLVCVDFNELRHNNDKRKDYVNLVNKIVDDTVRFVEEYTNQC